MEHPRDGAEPHGLAPLADVATIAATRPHLKPARPPARPPARTPARTGAFAASAAAGAALAWGLAALPFASPAACALGFGLFALAAVMAIEGACPPAHPPARFGAANVLTLARAAGAGMIAALAVEPRVLAGAGAWGAIVGVGVLLGLDGVDGWLARRQGTASAFGARFDMETDALLILALSALVASLGKAGPWVLAIGLMRYAFVAAGWLRPALARPLPPSGRRRAVCALQVGVLGLLLAPPLAPPLSGLLAAAALAALAVSFGVDLAWLARRAP